MKKRPLVLWLVGLALILSPIYYYVETGLYGRIPLTECGRILRAVPLVKMIGIGLGPVVGLLVLWVRPISWYAILGYSAYTMFVNFQIYLSKRTSGVGVLLFDLAGLACIIYFARREIRSPYFNPRLRWWESEPRHIFRLKVDVSGQESITCETFDISVGGLFLVTPRRFGVGDNLELTLHFPDTKVLVRGQVVWMSTGEHRPEGVGVRFNERNAEIAAVLKGLRHSTSRPEGATGRLSRPIA